MARAPKKQDLAAEVGRVLGIPFRKEWLSGGSKVTAEFEDDIGPAIGVPVDGMKKVDHMRAILEYVGVPWNSRRHSSEDAREGGSNIRREAYEDLLDALNAAIAEDTAMPGTILPSGPTKDFVQRSIRLRRGQSAFRKSLLRAYSQTCAITSTTAKAVLEAAHIRPFADGGTTDNKNGLLLRADIHTLFDLRLISIDSSSWSVLVHESLNGTEYERLRGTTIRKPRAAPSHPDKSAVDEHRRRSGL